MCRLMILLLLLLGAPAVAAPFEPCPSMTIGWALQFPPPIIAVLYDQSSLLLYVIFNNRIAMAYSNVPVSVMAAFSRSTNPTQVYNTYVAPAYNPLLLAEGNNCPILYENDAYIWTAPNSALPPTDFFLLMNGGFLLLASGGKLCLAGGC